MYTWGDIYEIGDAQIDTQHRKLFQICGKITEIFQDRNYEKNKRAAMEAIKYLKSYALQHFADEEALQIRVGYSGYAQHRKAHEDFTQTILMQEKILEAEGFSPESIQAFLNIVLNWLCEHIMRADQAILRDSENQT